MTFGRDTHARNPYEHIEESLSDMMLKPSDFNSVIGNLRSCLRAFQQYGSSAKRDYCLACKWCYAFFGNRIMEDWVTCITLRELGYDDDAILKIVPQLPWFKTTGWKEIAYCFAANEYIERNGKSSSRAEFINTKKTLEVFYDLDQVDEDEKKYYQLLIY